LNTLFAPTTPYASNQQPLDVHPAGRQANLWTRTGGTNGITQGSVYSDPTGLASELPTEPLSYLSALMYQTSLTTTGNHAEHTLIAPPLSNMILIMLLKNIDRVAGVNSNASEKYKS